MIALALDEAVKDAMQPLDLTSQAGLYSNTEPPALKVRVPWPGREMPTDLTCLLRGVIIFPSTFEKEALVPVQWVRIPSLAHMSG